MSLTWSSYLNDDFGQYLKQEPVRIRRTLGVRLSRFVGAARVLDRPFERILTIKAKIDHGRGAAIGVAIT
jgi:hypothetical protein